MGVGSASRAEQWWCCRARVAGGGRGTFPPFAINNALESICGHDLEWSPSPRQARLPEPEEEGAGGGGGRAEDDREAARVRARLVDQGERARPPWEGRRHDPMPPSSPGETPAGPSTLSDTRRLRYQSKAKRSRGHSRGRGIRNDCRGSLVRPEGEQGTGTSRGLAPTGEGRDSGTGVGRAHMRRTRVRTWSTVLCVR